MKFVMRTTEQTKFQVLINDIYKVVYFINGPPP